MMVVTGWRPRWKPKFTMMESTAWPGVKEGAKKAGKAIGQGAKEAGQGIKKAVKGK